MCNLDYGPQTPQAPVPKISNLMQTHADDDDKNLRKLMKTICKLMQVMIMMKKYANLWEQNVNLCSYDDDENEARLLFFGASWFNIDPTPRDLNLN